MEVRTCRITIADTTGVVHTVEVTAGTLYEAVALGLAAMRSDDWAAELRSWRCDGISAKHCGRAQGSDRRILPVD